MFYHYLKCLRKPSLSIIIFLRNFLGKYSRCSSSCLEWNRLNAFARLFHNRPFASQQENTILECYSISCDLLLIATYLSVLSHLYSLTFEVWEWVSNFIPQFNGRQIINTCGHLTYAMFVKTVTWTKFIPRWIFTLPALSINQIQQNIWP